MTSKRHFIIAAMAAAVVFTSTSCERSTDGLAPFPLSTEPVVFSDNFEFGLDYQAFLGSKLDAVDLDTNDKIEGTTSLRVTVPGPGNPDQTYAGGAFTTNEARDLSGYNALVFWAKASVNSTLDVAGFGNDNTGTSRFTAERKNIPLTTDWQRFIIPVPALGKMQVEQGLFFYAEGDETGSGQFIWFDGIRFGNVPRISNPRPVMPTITLTGFVGGIVEVAGTQTTFTVEGQDVLVGHMSGYYDFTSSDESVARFEDDAIKVVGAGDVTITAKLDGVDVAGTVSPSAAAPPASAAPTPTHAPADVISVFSNRYANRPVATFSADWDRADLTEMKIAGDDVKAYTNVLFAAIDWGTDPTLTIDASQMNYLHMHVYAPTGFFIKVKLVDYGVDGVFGLAPDSEKELGFADTTTPSFVPGQWVSLDIPFADFMAPGGIQAVEHLAQMTISGPPTIFVDNIYFHK